MLKMTGTTSSASRAIPGPELEMLSSSPYGPPDTEK